MLAERAAAALRFCGVSVDIAASVRPDPRGYDVAHVFGVFEPETAERQFAALRAHRVPIVLSPIWLDLRDYFATAPLVERALRARTAWGTAGRFERLRKDARALRPVPDPPRLDRRRVPRQHALMLAADVLLPASEIEAYLYADRLRIANVPSVVAPYGVDEDAFAVDEAPRRSGVLCAGRIESKKNQAALLYALRDLKVEVTLVGLARDESYAKLCRRWATRRTRFAGFVSRLELAALMRSAAVHAHPSWMEIPGLSSLEAAAAGARVVVGNRGTEREYLGDDAEYADPADPESIRAAVLRALERGPREADDRLAQRLRPRTWRAHAEATLEAYALAVSRRR